MGPRVAVTLEQCWHRVPGGTATSALGMVRALQDHTDLDLVGVAARHGRPPLEAFEPTIPVRQLPVPGRLLYESWHRFRRPPVERATGPVDAVYATGYAVPPAAAPILLTIHDLAFLHHPEHFTARGRRFFARVVELARDHADRVLCPSRATLADCAAHGFAEERLRHVPWGVAVARLDPVAIDEVRRRYRLHRPYVLWVGTVEPRKNLRTLAAAFGRLADLDVDLVLVGPAGWNEDIEGALAGLDRSRAHLLGFVLPEDLPPLYAGASVFCYPSLLEGFGLPVLEAMAQGAPVVTSKGTATEELAEGVGEVVDPTDAAGLAEALRRVLEDDQRAREMGDAGRAKAAEYSWGRTATAFQTVLHEVVG